MPVNLVLIFTALKRPKLSDFKAIKEACKTIRFERTLNFFMLLCANFFHFQNHACSGQVDVWVDPNGHQKIARIFLFIVDA